MWEHLPELQEQEPLGRRLQELPLPVQPEQEPQERELPERELPELQEPQGPLQPEQALHRALPER